MRKIIWPIFGLALLVLPLQMFAANLISNGDLESSSNGLPVSWIQGHWGNNAPQFSYPVTGVDGGKAAQTTISSLTSGDAKWAFESVNVTSGTQYEYTDFYKSSVPTEITNEYKMSNGTYQYQYLASFDASNDYKQATVRFTVPAGVVSMSVFHYIMSVGNMSIDNATLAPVGGTTPEPPQTGNLIPNPSLNPDPANALRPANWRSNAFGSNQSSFSYPISGQNGNGLRVTVNSYTSGDAKWYHEEIPVSAGEFYDFSDSYRGTAPSYLGIQFRKADGSRIYPDLGQAAPSDSWVTFERSFSVPSGVVGMIVYHAAQGQGTLETSNYSLKKVVNDPNKFSQGMISINFDDGKWAQYEHTQSVLNPLGLKSTHFIVPEYLSDNYTGYFKAPQVLVLEDQGHEIGAHSRGHVDLTKLSVADAKNQIEGSRADLFGIGVQNVNVFSYPFGSYNAEVESLVQEAGYTGARSTDGGQNRPNSDKFALTRFPVNVGTTFAATKAQIDKALSDRSWLVLVFHNIDYSGNTYSTTPETFTQIAQYIKNIGAKNVTLSQGISQMQP